MNTSPTVYDAAAMPWAADAVVPALVPGACLSRNLLLAFAAGMRAQGQPVQPNRMRYDRRYAMQCLAEAHGTGDPGLRSLALRLFDAYLGVTTRH